MKKNAFLGIGIALLSLLALNGYPQWKSNDTRAPRIQVGDLVIDQETHSWIQSEGVVEIELFIRNTGEKNISGDFIFLVKLDKKGLEASFLRSTVENTGDKLKSLLEKHSSENPKAEALLTYVNRGNRLEHGKKFELVHYEEKVPEPYTLQFRKFESLQPGNIVKITHKLIVPATHSGYLLEIELVNVE